MQIKPRPKSRLHLGECVRKELRLIQNGVPAFNFVFAELMVSNLCLPYCNCAFATQFDNEIVSLFFHRAEGDIIQVLRRPRRQLNKLHKLHWVYQICLGVRELHARGILHGDLKPENILVFNGQARVSDFGCACLADQVVMPPLKNKIYTGAYRPPEISQGLAWNLKSDIWALGLTIVNIFQHDTYEILKELTGRMLQPNLEDRPDIFQVISCLEPLASDSNTCQVWTRPITPWDNTLVQPSEVVKLMKVIQAQIRAREHLAYEFDHTSLQLVAQLSHQIHFNYLNI